MCQVTENQRKLIIFLTSYYTSVLIQRVFVSTTNLPGLHVRLQGSYFEPALFKLKTFYLIFKKSLKIKKKRFVRHVNRLIVFRVLEAANFQRFSEVCLKVRIVVKAI